MQGMDINMKIKILLILALIAVVLVSSTVGTLSSYNTKATFGVSVQPDSDKIRQQQSR